MILNIVLALALMHLISFGIFLGISARAPEGDEDEPKRERIRDGNVVSLSEVRPSKLAHPSPLERSARASSRQA